MKSIKNNAELKSLMNSQDLIVLDFYADWCGPCQQLLPRLEQLEKENSDVTFVKVNVDQSRELAQDFGIRSIPTLVMISDGKITDKLTGLHSNEQIRQYLGELRQTQTANRAQLN